MTAEKKALLRIARLYKQFEATPLAGGAYAKLASGVGKALTEAHLYHPPSRPVKQKE